MKNEKGRERERGRIKEKGWGALRERLEGEKLVRRALFHLRVTGGEIVVSKMVQGVVVVVMGMGMGMGGMIGVKVEVDEKIEVKAGMGEKGGVLEAVMVSVIGVVEMIVGVAGGMGGFGVVEVIGVVIGGLLRENAGLRLS